MSLQSQLTRLAHNVGALTADTNAIFEALRAKGVNVPANAQLSDVADMIEGINPPHQNEVEIGGRWYPYVQIGNQLWMAKNLELDISGSLTNAEHPEFGRYYNYSQMDAIPCPQGWRLATYSDLQSLDSNANHLSDRLLVSGDLGFNAMLCGEYYSNYNTWDGVSSVFKMWSSTEYAAYNRYELSLYPNNPIQIGFGAETYRPVRLVKDA